MTINRRHFLQRSLTASALLAASQFPFEAFAKGDMQRLVILHTNDQHSRIDPFPMDGGKYEGAGGFANRAAVIKKIRSEEPHVLLLDSGDVWQGTPYFNMYGGELEYKLMSEMRYDASTIGNHDFDIGLEGLVKQLPHAAFPFLCSNYDFSDTPMSGKTQPYKIFKYGDISVGVFGLGIALDGLVPKQLSGNTIYNDPIKAANKTSGLLKHDMQCDLVICLSHLGYKYETKAVSDVILAAETSNIDLILGGHTHTFFPKPEELLNSDKKKVIINQVGFAGIMLGKIEFYFEKKRRGLIIPNSPLRINT
jgi:5'-nucleotidase